MKYLHLNFWGNTKLRAVILEDLAKIDWVCNNYDPNAVAKMLHLCKVNLVCGKLPWINVFHSYNADNTDEPAKHFVI